MAELGMTPHPTGSHVRLSPSPKGEGRKTTRLRVASNRRADWQVVLCARGAQASSQGLCPQMKHHQLSRGVTFTLNRTRAWANSFAPARVVCRGGGRVFSCGRTLHKSATATSSARFYGMRCAVTKVCGICNGCGIAAARRRAYNKAEKRSRPRTGRKGRR